MEPDEDLRPALSASVLMERVKRSAKEAVKQMKEIETIETLLAQAKEHIEAGRHAVAEQLLRAVSNAAKEAARAVKGAKG